MTPATLRAHRDHVRERLGLPASEVDILNGEIRVFGTGWDTWGECSADATISPPGALGFWSVTDHHDDATHHAPTIDGCIATARDILIRNTARKAAALERKARRMRDTIAVLRANR